MKKPYTPREHAWSQLEKGVPLPVYRQFRERFIARVAEDDLEAMDAEPLAGDYEATDTGAFEDFEGDQVRQRLKEAMAKLPPRVSQVLALRFFANWTLEEVAKSFERSRERIRQIESKGLRLLYKDLRIYRGRIPTC